MYQMLTGALPYDTPAPSDLEKLMTGELVSPPRMKNMSIPKAISDIVMRAMAPDVATRYQRASDLLDDLLASRPAPVKKVAAAAGRVTPTPEAVRLPRARDARDARFCRQCRKPLHARTDRCPFCGEAADTRG
jgi:serine/threonine protein kinase